MGIIHKSDLTKEEWGRFRVSQPGEWESHWGVYSYAHGEICRCLMPTYDHRDQAEGERAVMDTAARANRVAAALNASRLVELFPPDVFDEEISGAD